VKYSTTGLAAEDDVPPPLENLYELLNSLDERRFVNLGRRHEGGDELRSERDVERWLRRRGLLGPGERVSSADMKLVLDFRRRLREVLEVQAHGGDSAAAVEELNATVARLSAGLLFDPDGTPGLQPRGTATRRALARLLAAAVEAQQLSLWPRLKMCAADDCCWVFYDHSKPRTGKWCSTSVCGNREKRRAYRRRHAQSAGRGR
jgi:predicted RNA-binding Zn ribbon-like protein